MTHQQYLTWRQYFWRTCDRDRSLAVASEVNAHVPPSFFWGYSWERQDTWSLRSNPVLVANPTTNDVGDFWCEIRIIHSCRNFQPLGGWSTPSRPNLFGLEGAGKQAAIVHIPIGNRRRVWSFNAPTWEVMRHWTTVDCLKHYMNNSDPDDDFDWENNVIERDNYRTFRDEDTSLRWEYRQQDVELVFFRSSCILQIPNWVAAELMYLNEPYPELNCLEAIKAIMTIASSDADVQRAERCMRALAYIPQWLFFVYQFYHNPGHTEYTEHNVPLTLKWPWETDITHETDGLSMDENEWERICEKKIRKKEIEVWFEELHHNLLRSALTWKTYFQNSDDLDESTKWENVGNPKEEVQRKEHWTTSWGNTKHPLLIATKGEKQLEVVVVHNHCIMKHDQHRAVALVGCFHMGEVVQWPLLSDGNTFPRQQHPWRFEAPTWEVMCRWTSVECLDYYMANYDSDDTNELFPSEHEDYAEWKMPSQYRKRDVEEKCFAESSLLEIPAFMVAALMTRRLKSPADLCLLAIATIKARAGQCRNKKKAGFQCKAYAYIPQWLYFVTLLDKQKSYEEVKKDVDSLITLQCIDEWLGANCLFGAALLSWYRKLHYECLYKQKR